MSPERIEVSLTKNARTTRGELEQPSLILDRQPDGRITVTIRGEVPRGSRLTREFEIDLPLGWATALAYGILATTAAPEKSKLSLLGPSSP